MTRRERLLPWTADGDADATLGRLMRAGRNDGPPAESLRAAPRAVAALLATAVTATASTAAGSAAVGAAALGAKKSLSAALLAKWFAVGAIAGGTVAVAANVPRLLKPAPEVKADMASRAPLEPPERPKVPAREIVPESPVEVTAPSTTARARSDSDIAREVAILDRARAALAAGSPAHALEVLDTSQQLPARSLVPEATILRVRALLALGDVAGAGEVTQRFASRAPDSPQLGVLRGLLEAHGKAPPPLDADAGIRTPGSKL